MQTTTGIQESSISSHQMLCWYHAGSCPALIWHAWMIIFETKLCTSSLGWMDSLGIDLLYHSQCLLHRSIGDRPSNSIPFASSSGRWSGGREDHDDIIAGSTCLLDIQEHHWITAPKYGWLRSMRLMDSVMIWYDWMADGGWRVMVPAKNCLHQGWYMLFYVSARW